MGDDDSDSDDTDDDIEWTEVNWAQCDLCNKWRKLPFGPEYCAEALPEKWFCYMNAESLSHFCEDPEDEMDANERYDDPIAMEELRWRSSIEEKAAAAEPPLREGDESGGDAPPRPKLSLMAPLLPSGASSARADSVPFTSFPVPIGEQHQVSALPRCDQSSEHDAGAGAPRPATPLSHSEVEKEAAVSTAKLLTDAAIPPSTLRASASSAEQPPWEGLPLATPAGDRDEGVASAPQQPVPSPRQPVAPPPKPIAPPPSQPAAPPSVKPEATSNSTWAALIMKNKKAGHGK